MKTIATPAVRAELQTKVFAEFSFNLWLIKVISRVSLGLVWFWEGLVPKIISISPGEIEMVRRSGLFSPTPQVFLVWLGVAQMIAGLVLIVGWAERLSVTVATTAMGILIVLVVANAPAAVVDPYGGLPKDFCLIACAVVVWVLSPIAPGVSNPGKKWRTS